MNNDNNFIVKCSHRKALNKREKSLKVLQTTLYFHLLFHFYVIHRHPTTGAYLQLMKPNMTHFRLKFILINLTLPHSRRRGLQRHYALKYLGHRKGKMHQRVTGNKIRKRPTIHPPLGITHTPGVRILYKHRKGARP